MTPQIIVSASSYSRQAALDALQKTHTYSQGLHVAVRKAGLASK
jgi:hypothetical protein